MTVASGSNVELAYYEETTQGEDVATPVYQKVNVTSESIGLSRDTIQSEALRADRQIPDIINGTKQVGGDIGTEVRYGEFDDWFEAALGGTWTGDVLKAGTTRRFFHIERKHADLTKYFRNKGCEFSGFSLERGANAITTVSWNVLGLSQTIASTIETGATYTDANANEPMNGFSGTFTIDGLSDKCVTSASVSLDNGAEALFCIGSESAFDQTQGKSTVTGSFSVYFEDTAMIDEFNAGTYTDAVFTILDGAGNQYEIDLPKIKYTSADTSVGGPEVLTFSYDFSAVYDATEATNLKITRTPA